ncbi:protein MpGID1L2 [Marchantia polymorpha subsp. ruderalis]|uniref:Alpha/beta hydrolase fold-3 domain-containing protein n=2 Tax=Marchantia polymorpha TaxID=3197 RepID=A0AAF6BYI5_MARPO|nr:hypothetical protein MARPO_0003s0183 [Marchantia polymorpha]BBN17069.1 hypothetical protein Mp_7g11710 [Marchantia polymorpha subsp. ruderalis]|eukprot:PTQ49304.1 hypothetical protein MARPO_0003s0183 [Marchantia polymorpha]
MLASQGGLGSCNADMSTPPLRTDSSKNMDVTPSKVTPKAEEFVPMSVRMVGAVLRRIDSWVYRKDGTVNRARQDFFEVKAKANAKPVNGVSTKDVVIDPATGVWARVFTPDQEIMPEFEAEDGQSEKKLPVIVYYHGGGFVGMSPDVVVYDKLCRRLARAANAVVVSVHYRRAPEFRYPVAYEDSFRALEWLQSAESQEELPGAADLTQCFLAGDSAGGNIVHFVGCMAAKSDLRPIQLRGLVLLQPFFGGEDRTTSELTVNPPVLSLERADWGWKAFLPEDADRDHPACNVSGPNSMDISTLRLPPVFVVIGTLDILKDWQMRYVKKLEKHNKQVRAEIYVGGFHSFYAFEGNELGDRAMADVVAFIDSHMDLD